MHSFSREVHREAKTRMPPKHQAAVLEISVVDCSSTTSSRCGSSHLADLWQVGDPLLGVLLMLVALYLGIPLPSRYRS